MASGDNSDSIVSKKSLKWFGEAIDIRQTSQVKTCFWRGKS